MEANNCLCVYENLNSTIICSTMSPPSYSTKGWKSILRKFSLLKVWIFVSSIGINCPWYCQKKKKELIWLQ